MRKFVRRRNKRERTKPVGDREERQRESKKKQREVHLCRDNLFIKRVETGPGLNGRRDIARLGIVAEALVYREYLRWTCRLNLGRMRIQLGRLRGS